MENQSQLTKTFILQPLREALEAHDVHEDSVIGVLSDILHDDEQPGATRLNACKMFLGMIGLVNESRHIDMEVTHRVADALADLNQKRIERKAERHSEIEWDTSTGSN